MEQFNKMLDMIKNKETGSPDTDTDTGSFGNIEGEDATPSSTEEKLVLHLEGGVEIHIPTAVYNEMSNAMNGVEAPATPCDSLGALEVDGESEENPTDDNKTDCPFDKKDESEEKEEDDYKKDNPVEEGCNKHKKKKGRR